MHAQNTGNSLIVAITSFNVKGQYPAYNDDAWLQTLVAQSIDIHTAGTQNAILEQLDNTFSMRYM